MDKWDQRYSEPGFAYGTSPNEFLASVVGRIPKGRVLSLAEGEGRNAVFLASKGYEVVAVDSSAVGLAKARQLAAEHGVRIETVVADLKDFDPGREQWDAVISIFCHVPPAIRVPLHISLVAGLKKGGVLVLEAFDKDQLRYGTGGPPTEDMLMSLHELKHELKGLEFVHGVEKEREVVEGSRHTGLAAVVQVVGVKP